MELSRALLKDLLILTKDGEWGDGKPSDSAEPMLTIRGTDFAAVRSGEIGRVPLRYINREIARRKRLEPGDILIETAGGTADQPTGRTLLLRPSLFEHAGHPVTCASFARFLRVDRERVVPEYLFWYLQELYRNGQMHEYHLQHTGVARFQYTLFASETEVSLPSLHEQEGITAILERLDDKIELNRRMNQTLESMARAIFRSWFVDFDPVVAKAAGRQPFGMSADVAALFPHRFVDSGMGPIPSGWQLGRLDDLVVLQRGYDLPATQRTPGIYPVLSAGGLTGTHCEFKVRGPGVTTGRSGQLGAVYFVHEDFWPLNTSLYVKEFRASSPLHAYFLLQTLDFDSFNAGSAVPTLNRNHVHNLPVVVPGEKLLTYFGGFAGPLFNLSHNNEAESRTLAALRDTLLPKLMSGELRLRDAEKLAGIHV